MSVELRLALQERRSADLAERVRRLLGPFTGNEAALDAGCGTGSLAFALAPHVAEVVGLDTREEYLEAGRASAPANVRFEVGDVMELPFGYAEFDLVCCHRVLHHVRRPELAVSELARVTRPGGKLFIADQLGDIDPLVNLEQDRFERLRDATHQRLLPEADVRGFAYTLEELEVGLNAVAAPVRESTGRVRGAVSVSGPSFRLTRARIPEYGRLVRAAGVEISRRMGFPEEAGKEEVQ